MLGRRKQGTPDHAVLPISGQCALKTAVLSAPDRDQAEAGLYGFSGEMQGLRETGVGS
jgi:hypothetical protein